jgi:hypothetical protein
LKMSQLELLSLANAKIMRGEAFGYITAVLHLAPSWLSGYNACPMASVGCALGCLNLAGRGGMFKKGSTSNVVQRARIRKTKLFFEARDEFVAMLVRDIERFVARCEREGMRPCIRLNGTSDIRWETVSCVRGGVEYANVMDAFGDVQFYDYTKIPNRRNLPPNYHLTFSLSETNEPDALRMLAAGMSVAVVFADSHFPESFWGAPVVNGDTSDLRFLDGAGNVVALKAKGPAKKDTSGFVKRAQQEMF